MKQSITFSMFCDAFRACNRNENFSYDGKRVLFDYLESLEWETEIEIKLDVIALCCEYSEGRASDVIEDYSLTWDESMNDEELIGVAREYLQENTIICGEHSNGVFVYVQF